MAGSDLIFVDVSHWNPEEDDRTHHRLMDWNVARAAGLTGVVVKYTQGAYAVDPAAFAHAWAAYQAGVPLLGAYHYGNATSGDIQAKHFLDVVKQDYAAGLDGVMLMLDAEQGSGMTAENAALFVQTIYDEVGRWPWLYTGRFGPTGDGKGLPNATLSKCPLLVAAYGRHENNLGDYMPKGFSLPTEATNTVGVCRGWQFTDGKINGGPYPGLGVVDQSRFIGVESLDEARVIWAK